MEDGLLMIEENGEEVTEEQKEALYKRVEELKYSNAVLRTENAMFEQFLGRLDPQELLTPAGGEGPRVPGSSQQDGGGWRRRSRANVSDRLQLLTLEQKLYMAQREVRETQEDQEKLKQKYERTQDDYKASIEEAELRLAEIKKAKNEFERKLLKPMKDNRVAMKEPEKVLQYIEDKLKVSQLEKFHLKNQALKVHEKKLLQQLQQKKEMGKVEYEDFFQEYNESRVDKNLDELQINSLKVQRVLSSHKREKLQSVTLESTELSNDISKRRQLLAKIEEEIQHAEEERLKAETFNQHLRRQLADYQAPGITEYMYVKDKLKKLRQSVHTWERKMALKTHTKAWSKPRSTLTPANSVEVGTQPGDHRLPVKLPSIAEHNT